MTRYLSKRDDDPKHMLPLGQELVLLALSGNGPQKPAFVAGRVVGPGMARKSVYERLSVLARKGYVRPVLGARYVITEAGLEALQRTQARRDRARGLTSEEK